MRLFYLLGVIVLFAPLMACDPINDTSTRAASSSKQVIHNAKESWKDLFTYHPRVVPNSMPQTRYCYRMQTDIVCYDSPQAGITAPLVGYQDGESVAWFKDGGGSSGFSNNVANVFYSGDGMAPVATGTVPAMAPIEVKPNPPPFKKQVK